MAWYKTGKVQVTLNSATVAGTTTDFVSNVRVGDAFIGPNGALHEVTNVASATVLSISPVYSGASASNASYGIVPVQGYPKQLADQAGQILTNWGATLAGLGPVASQSVVPVAMGGTGGVTPAAARTGLELKSGALAEVLGTVAASGGSPTGALMERGSNANGTYEKFACGTLICRRSLAINRTVNVSYNGAYAATSAETARTFPAAFSSMPAISIAANGANGPTMIGYQDFSFSDSAWPAWPPILIYGTTPRAAQWYTICYTAIGRWFE